MTMREDPPGFVVEEFVQSADLLDALSRRDARWEKDPHIYRFRGQADSTWSLVPSAHRSGIGFSYGPKRYYSHSAENWKQIQAESLLVRDFITELNRQGLQLPTEAAWRWSGLVEVLNDLISGKEFTNWPPEELAPIFALAQHYGVPTRLLDWTARPLVAAYFAAVDAAKRARLDVNRDGSLAVWCASLSHIRIILQADLERPKQPELRIVEAPKSTNPNLRAQEGIFSVLVDKNRGWNDPSDYPPLDEILRLRLREFADGGSKINRPPLRKFVLPVSEAGTLLRLLSHEWVSATYLYPGLDGVVRGLKERALWDNAAGPE